MTVEIIIFQDLLSHPVSMALIRHKWNTFGRQAYAATFLNYLLYILFLTVYVIETPAPYSSDQILLKWSENVGKLP